MREIQRYEHREGKKYLVSRGEVVEDILALGEDGVVGLEPVLGQELRLHRGGDVEQGVTHTQQNSLLHTKFFFLKYP